MIVTRRNFFRNVFDNLKENIQESIPAIISIRNEFQNSSASVSPITKAYEEKHESENWISIGHISDFPVGISLPVNNDKQILVSKSEGLYALDLNTFNSEKTEPRKLIKINERGVIMMSQNQVSPVGTILSILTGDLVIEEEI